MTDDKIAYAIKVMNESGMVLSGDALTLGIGAMTDARWQRFYKSMADVGVAAQGPRSQEGLQPGVRQQGRRARRDGLGGEQRGEDRGRNRHAGR